MARKGRAVSGIGIYHVLLRGVDTLFLTETDFDAFITAMKQKMGSANVISYVLLKNRIHIIINTDGESVGKVLKPIATSYARYCNRTRGTKGKLFYDRFKSEPILSQKELFNAVAFVNFIANMYRSRYSSLYNPVCSLKDCGITEKQAKSTEFENLAMEDYDCLSKSELGNYIYAFCGIYAKDIKRQPKDVQEEILEKLIGCGRFSKSKIYDFTGLKKK